MPKSRLKKKSLKSKLTWIFIALAIFLGGSVYAALQTGTGPLSFLTKTPDVNKIACLDDDDDCIEANFMAKRQGLKGLQADQAVTQITTQLKNDNKFIRNEDGKVIKNPDYDPSQTTSTSNTSNSTTSTSSSAPGSCAGGNGVKLTPGKYAATGYGWEDGKRSTKAGTSQRECVYIDDDCGHSVAVACDEVYKAEPAKVILPVSAGTEYYAGKTPAQIREDEKKDITPPSKPKENCYDKSGVIMVTGSSLGEDKCFNGEWLSDKTDPTKPDSLSDLDNKIIATCSTNNTQYYDKEKNKCITPTSPTVPTDSDIKTQKDRCRGENKEYDTTNNACGKSLKCGPGYTERAGFCDLAPYSASEIIRENIITSGEKFCKEQDKKFEQSTGLCIATNQTPSAGRPRECDPKKMYSQGTKEGYRFCEFDSSNKVIGEKYVFCDSSTSTYDSKTGTCIQIRNLTPGSQTTDTENCASKKAMAEVKGGPLICTDASGNIPSAVTPATSTTSTNNLTSEHNNKLNDPAKPWAENNPVLVKNESDCPDDSNIDSVYLPNTDGPTFRCTPKVNQATVPAANPGNNPRISRPLTPPSSTFVQTTGGALEGAAIGGTVGALVCGGLAWGLGSLTFGGTIILAPAAAGYCATFGATLGATIGGINSYESAK